MKQLVNENKYLSTDLIQACFEPGRVNWVSKGICGNGFTTGFSFIEPKRNKLNVLICPNIAVAEDKKKDYHSGRFGFEGAQIGFLYQGSRLEKSIFNYDLLVVVADSFIHNYFKLELSKRTDKLLIDESHSVEQQSIFRFSLVKMQRIINDYFNASSVCYVTATPNLYSNVNIQIKNNIEKTTLNISRNPKNTIKRAIESINEGLTTLIFTNNASIIDTIITSAGINEFRLIGGSKIKSSIYKKNKVFLNENSKVIFVTSAGMEGWSLCDENCRVFMFVNYNSKNEQFLASNIYQAFNRPRNGYKYGEVCILKTGKDFPVYDAEEVVNYLVNNEDIEIKYKQKRKFRFRFNGKEYENRHYINFIEFYNEEEKVYCRPFQNKININKELIQAETDFINTYKDFFSFRNVDLILLDEQPENKQIRTRKNRAEKISNLVFNLSNDETIFKECFLQKKPKDLNSFIKEVEDVIQVASGAKITIEDKYLKCYELLTKKEFYNDLLQLYLKRQAEKKEGTIKGNKETFKEETFKYCLDIIHSILTDYVQPYFIGHRDYNTFVAVNNYILEYIAEGLGLYFYELDIRNAYPRFVHRLNGLELPEHFYNHPILTRSEVKTNINRILNDLSINVNSYIYNRKKRGFATDEKQIQNFIKNKRRKDRNELREYGFNETIIDWLLDNFSNNPDRGALFNLLSFHERNLISAAKKEIRLSNPQNNFFEVRKHDAILYFFTDQMEFNSGKYIQYLDSDNWF